MGEKVIKSLVFITGNKEKAKQLSRYLDFPVLHREIDLPEIQSLDLTEIIKYKAEEAYRKVGKLVLIEDISLKFKVLGGLPGTLIKWFLSELGNKGLCQILDGYSDRSAFAEVNFGLFDGRKLKIFKGVMPGSISKSPKGDKIFGWDPIFIPKGYKKTWGEMNIKEQKKTSIRKIALKKLEAYLRRKK